MLLPLPKHSGPAIFNLAPLRFYQTDYSDYSDGEGDDSNEAGLSGMRGEEFHSVQGRSGIEQVDDLDYLSVEEKHASLMDLSPSQIESLSQIDFNKVIEDYFELDYANMTDEGIDRAFSQISGTDIAH